MKKSYHYGWALFVDYGGGWEYELSEDSMRELKQQRKAYQLNMPQFPTKIARHRVYHE